MRINYSEENGIVLSPEGAFNYCSGNECLNQLNKFLADHPIDYISIDFSEVNALDSSGVGALISLSKTLPPNATRLRLLYPQPNILNLLEVCHLRCLFDIVTEEKPIKSA